jgi:hypothetical protein
MYYYTIYLLLGAELGLKQNKTTKNKEGKKKTKYKKRKGEAENKNK